MDITISTRPGTCACGCGEPTSSRFRPGHDQRLKGVLARTAAAGGQVELGDGTRVAPAAYGQTVFTPAGLAALLRGIEKATRKPPADVAGTVRQGRWSYAAVRGVDGAVTYTRRDGSTHQADAKTAATFEPAA